MKQSRIWPGFGLIVAGGSTLLACAWLAPTTQAQMTATPTFTLDIRGAPIGPVLRSLFHSAGKNFTVDPDIHSTVTVAVTGASFDRTLATVSAAASPPLTVSLGHLGFRQNSLIYQVRLAAPSQAATASALQEGPSAADIAGHGGAAPAPAVVPSTGPHLTSAQAIHLARAFCRKIGQPVTGPGKAVFPEMEHADFYWQPRWEVGFPHQAWIQVVDATRVIAEYEDDTRQEDRPLPRVSRVTVLKMLMPQSEAIRRAKQALAATGQPEGMAFRFASMVALTAWDLDWERALDGIPYEDASGTYPQFETADVTVDTGQGRINCLRFVYPYPPLARAVVRVTREQAIRAVQAYVSEGRDNQIGMPYGDAALRIAHLHGAAYAVWIVRAFGSHGDDVMEKDIWVDAERGKVIADLIFRPPGHY